MRTCNELIGMPVRCASRVLGCVSDICFSYDGKCIGLLIDEQKMPFMYKKVFLPAEQIVQADAAGIYTGTHLMSSADQPEKYLRYNQLKQKMIVNQEKKQLGILEDVYISFQAGTMVAYEISDGFFADLQGERRHIPSMNTAMTLNNDTIMLAEQ
ncbi:PRC-barrel domain-containing protein [Bacillus gobiensis]|uniref:PRC-barrel domain-containing protein n=1 Tax=Bacillus gobiensis TaxID=1441095 RepID=UPI003D1C1188